MPEPEPDHRIIEYDLGSLSGDQRRVLASLLAKQGISSEWTSDGIMLAPAGRINDIDEALDWLHADLAADEDSGSGDPVESDHQTTGLHVGDGAPVSRQWWNRMLVSAPAWVLAWLSFIRVWAQSDDGLSFVPVGFISAVLCWLYVWVNRRRRPDLKYAAILAAFAAADSLLLSVIG